MQASHCRPVSDCVRRPFCRNSQLGRQHEECRRYHQHLDRAEDRRRQAARRLRRRTRPLKIVPSPMTTKHIVIDALGASVDSVSGPATSGTRPTMNRTAP